MIKPIIFTVSMGKKTVHWVNVVVYPSRAAMRRCLKRQGHKSDNTQAACWQANNPTKDGCVAELHFGIGAIDLATIVHECAHAGFHRAELVGIPFKEVDFQEWLCDDTGLLVDAIVAQFDQRKIKIPLRCVPKRRVITTR